MKKLCKMRFFLCVIIPSFVRLAFNWPLSLSFVVRTYKVEKMWGWMQISGNVSSLRYSLPFPVLTLTPFLNTFLISRHDGMKMMMKCQIERHETTPDAMLHNREKGRRGDLCCLIDHHHQKWKKEGRDENQFLINQFNPEKDIPRYSREIS